MAEPIELKKRTAFSGWPMLLGWAAMLIFAFHASTHMVGAGDTWVALACGRHFLNHGVDTVEPFSANSHRAGPTEEDIEKWPAAGRWIADKVGLETVKYWHPTGWVNQNWLTHVIFYWLTHESPFADADTFSFNSLVYWKFAIYIITVICVYYIGRVLGVNGALSAVFACFAMFVGRSFFDVRPAGFSNMLTAAYLLVLVLATYRNILWIWLIVPMAVFWCNVHGGYLYVFIMLVPFFGLNLLTVLSKKRFTSIGVKGLYHTAAAGVAAFVAMILFNPFHLTNLTHTFEISFSKHAEKWRTVNEWHPAFEWSNPVGDEIPFLIMYIIGWLLIVVWAVALIFAMRYVKRRMGKRKLKDVEVYQWPKIDLALMAIAALTIYMAIRSRRFIPIAAIAACPVLAMFIDQMVRSISAARNFGKQNRLVVLPMGAKLQSCFILCGAAAVLFFGTWWGLKFKRIYLDPWPTDAKFNSVFMRMTASDAKPFYACQFIRENKLSGNMFNYWTEGGFIGWGQEPDRQTGKTGLQLFMDGRAQAAYERKNYDRWATIMSGGPEVYTAHRRQRAVDHKKVGKWIGNELNKHKVWVILMPRDQFNSAFVKGIERNPDWQLAFLNDRQKLFVNIKTGEGKKLFEGIFTGKTVYPDEFSKNLILAYNMFLLYSKDGVVQKQALSFAFKAFELKPSFAAAQTILFGARFGELRGDIYKFCKDYFEEFENKRDDWAAEDGYHNKLLAALNTVNYLQRIAESQKDDKQAQFYKDRFTALREEQVKVMSSKRW